jgi:hypothetical protein
MTAMQEFVVPKSMPNTFAIKFGTVGRSVGLRHGGELNGNFEH